MTQDELPELTEEQKEKFSQLRKKFFVKGMVLTLKWGFMFIFSTFVVATLNVFFVHSEAFAMIGGILNGIMMATNIRIGMTKQEEEVREEIKKILEK